MNSIIRWMQSVRLAALSFAVGSTIMIENADAQSNLVFMTTEEHLHRFDLGLEVYAVNTGGGDAFLGVTILNGDVLVADFLGEDIERFSPGGTHLGTFGSPPGAPTFLESDHNGNVYTTLFALPLGPELAVRMNAAGVVTGTFGASAGIDADAAGNVYAILDDDLVKYASNGSVLSTVGVPGFSPWDVSIDESGNRLFVTTQDQNIWIYDISTSTPGLSGSISAPMSAVTAGVHFAAESGNVLATDIGVSNGDPRGIEFSPSGSLLREFRAATNDIAWDIVTMVPEPASFVLLVVAFLGATLANGRSVRTWPKQG